MSGPTLRPYQREQLAAIADAIDGGLRRVLIKSPTGTGKTVTFAAMLDDPRIKDWLYSVGRGHGASMLVIAHREELLDQAAEKILKANPGLTVMVEQGERRASRYSDVVIASIQTLAAMKFRRLKRLIEQHSFRLVIVDEAHHAAAATYRTALVHLGFLPTSDASDSTDIDAPTFDDITEMEAALRGWDVTAPKDRLLVGVTATPNRSDAIGLNCVFQSMVYSYPLKKAIDDGWLVPIRPWVVETDTDLDSVRTSHGDFVQKELSDAVNTQRRNQLAVAAWNERATGLPTLAFTVDVAHAHSLADAFMAAGVRARALSGETPKDERRDMLRRFANGSLDVITNCMVLTEGTDLPMVQCILHAKPTKSATLYEQMTGRGLRLFPGKAECVVIDVADLSKRHSLQAAPTLYGLPPGLMVSGQTLKEAEDLIEELRLKYPTFDIDAALQTGHLTLAELRAKATEFDIWKVPDLGALKDAVTLNWIRTRDQVFRLSYPWGDGIETLTVQPDLLGHYDVAATLRPHVTSTGLSSSPRQRTLAAELKSPEAALRLAEAYIYQERSSVPKMKKRDAPWRDRPASPKQLAYLAKLNVPHNPKKLTMGAASDLIDIAQSRRVTR